MKKLFLFLMLLSAPCYAATNIHYVQQYANLWTPSNITTRAWYDASDTNSITDTGGLADQWDDKSSNGYDLTQTTAARKPATGTRTIGGLNVLDFDGGDDVIQRSASMPIFRNIGAGLMIGVFACDATNAATDETVLYLRNAGNNNTRASIRIENSTSPDAYSMGWRRLDGDAFSSYNDGQVTTNAAIEVADFDFANDFYNISLNGTTNAGTTGISAGNSSDTDATVMSVGAVSTASQFFDGRVGEIIIVETNDITTRQLCEGYLAHKWSLEANLPSDHPYRWSAPLDTTGPQIKKIVYVSTCANLWTPSNITTIVWYDAADTNTISDVGGAVSQWDDKSGNNNHAAQTEGIRQPKTGTRTIGGVNVLDFGGGQHLDMTNAVDFIDRSFFVVLNHDSIGGGKFVLGSTGAIDNRIGQSSGTLLIFAATNQWKNGSFGSVSSSGTISSTTDYIIQWVGDDPATFWVDGTQDATTNARELDDPFWIQTIGMYRDNFANVFDGKLAEIVLVDNPDTATRQKMEGYLAHKWGLETKLPTNHPYYAEAPLDTTRPTKKLLRYVY